MYWEIDVKIRRLCDKRNVFGPLLVKLEGFYSLLLSSRLSVDHNLVWMKLALQLHSDKLQNKFDCNFISTDIFT